MLPTLRGRIALTLRPFSTAKKMSLSMKSIDLLRGHPTTSLLATTEMQEAAQRVLSNSSKFSLDSYAEDRHPLHYGPDLGNEAVRRDIGRWTAKRYGLSAEETPGPERINMTSGASNGLASILTLFTSPGTGYTRRAFIISPTYFLACAIFQDAGFSNLMTSIPMSADGTSIDFDALVKALEEDKKLPPQPLPDLNAGLSPIKSVKPKELYRYVLYCVTTHSNPTGTTMSMEARKRLVELAREWDMLLISDDVYDFLSYEQSRPAVKSLVTVDKEMGVKDGSKGHTISNCSFSKLLGPGLRVGWVESASGVLAREIGESGANHSGGAPCHFASTIVHDLIGSDPTKKSPIDTVIDRLSVVYGERCQRLIKAIESHFPAGTTVKGGQGGYFIWVELPEGFNAREIAKIAKEAEDSVIVGGGDLFECPDGEGVGASNKLDWGKRCMRLAISYQEADVLEEGTKRLARAIDTWQKRTTGVQG